jgi:hypothetical protein
MEVTEILMPSWMAAQATRRHHENRSKEPFSAGNRRRACGRLGGDFYTARKGLPA